MSLVIASQMEDSFNAQLQRHPSAPTLIAAPEADPWSTAAEADVLITRPSPAWRGARDLPRPPGWPGRLKWVYSASAGVDFYPPWLLEAPLVTCGRGVASEEIADYVIAAIYLRSKDLEAVRARSPDQWVNVPLGRVAGTTVGLVGFGAIGQAVARRALALGARVTAVRRQRHLPSAVSEVHLLDTLEEVVASADHLVLALPGTAQTRNLIDAAVLAQAKPGAHLINVGRGSVLDHQALVTALDSNVLGFATLDVTEPEPLPAGHPLWTHPRVRLTPHVASNHTLVRHVFLEKVGDNLDRFARGEDLLDRVDPATGY
ncbi:NAD(P)-dependent oxidoreductase [Caulobacter soli]|uniref:NAD(P)-dependent oxidoreductase n=1 Tax=Caulobacter soli TaxID=2708539 RepID=UPI0013EC16E2|nr:NAD(P)-dependent oxidoreductase [Caulobacter soli]